MRVTWVSLEWPRTGQHSGGVGRYVARLAERVAESVDLTVVTYEGAMDVDGVRLVTIPAPRSRIDRYYVSAWHVRHAVERSQCDLVHAHGDDFLVRHRRPVVRSFYGTSWGEAKSSRGLRRVNHAVLAGTEWWSARSADLKLGIAPESVEMFDCDYIFPPYLRPPGPPHARKPSTAPTVVFIGSHGGRKQGHVAEASVQVLRRRDPSTRLVVVGPASDAPSWAPWVEHHSGLDDAGVSDLLSSAWVLAAPSLYEGFGIPLVEALDHGAAVVARPNPGARYITGLASTDVPVDLVAEDGFPDALRRRLQRGPSLDGDEAAAADSLVKLLAAEGSPSRLVELYESLTG